jgi:hypothetical protein
MFHIHSPSSANWAERAPLLMKAVPLAARKQEREHESRFKVPANFSTRFFSKNFRLNLAYEEPSP